ncbi:MAG: hypothetical protein J6D11_06360 [Clostridia bacterium]|nr:hypothetical protein [Clostridia bacterium]
MKKIISLVLALALMFSLAACTKTIMGPEKTNGVEQTTTSGATTEQPQTSPENKSAYDVVLNAINKTTDLSSFSATTNSHFSIQYLSVNESTTVKTKINAQGVNTSSLRFSAFSEYTEGSEKIDTNVYFENNNYYVDSYGIKVKLPASRGGDAYDYFAEIDKYFLPLSESCYDSVPVTDLNGGKSVIVNASAEDCEKDFDDIIKETVSSFEESGLGEIKFTGASVRATTNAKGYIDVYTVSLHFDWAVQIGVMHAKSNIDMVWSIDFEKYGDVSVTAPEGYASYKEIAADEMAYVLLSERVDFMKSLDDIYADCLMSAEMQIGANKAGFTISDIVRAKNLASSPSVSHNMQITLGDSKEAYDIYYENGYYYYRDNNESFKFSESVAKSDYKSTSPAFDIVKALSANAMKNASVSVLGGEINITAMPDATIFAKEFSVLVNELNYSIMGAPVNEYKIYAPCVNVVIDANGFIKSYALIYAVEIPIGNDQTIYTSIEASVEFKNLGEDVEITFPDGYWSFQEITTDILY